MTCCRERRRDDHAGEWNCLDLSTRTAKKQEARCIFEYIYFARPDSHIDGVSVYASRIKAGRFLAMDSPVDADLVVGVPESGNAAALGYSCSLAFHTEPLLSKMVMWDERLSSRNRAAVSPVSA